MGTVSIFVSSTFRDFHAERDAMIGDVTARLDELIAPLGCRVEMIDLRWGIDTAGDDEDRQQSRVLDVCLSELRRARPLFVGLVGARYGWVPPAERLLATVGEAGVDLGSAEAWSVTRLELEEGALRAASATPVVFVRELEGDVPLSWMDEHPDAISVLRERVRLAAHVHDVPFQAEVRNGALTQDSVRRFEDLAFEHLAPIVLERARAVAVEALDPYLAAETLFVESRAEVLVGRSADLERLLHSLRQPSSRIVLTGPSGVGKSAMWSALVSELRAEGHTVLSVGIGVSPGTTSDRDLAVRLLNQLGDDPPSTLGADQLVSRLGEKLSGSSVVVALDALDRLDPGLSRDTVRILTRLGPGPSVICTTADDRQVELLRSSGYSIEEVGPLSPSAVRDMVDGLARKHHREIPEAARRALASTTRDPLWVQLAFAELLGLDQDDFRDLPPGPGPIAALLTSTAAGLPAHVDGLAQRVFERCRARVGEEIASVVFGALAISRSGLVPADLAELAGATPLDIARLRRAAAGTLAVTGEGGRIGFTHAATKTAATSAFVGDSQALHASLADLLVTSSDTGGLTRGDSVFHAYSSGDAGRLSRVVGRCVDQGVGPPELSGFSDALLAEPTTGVAPEDVLLPTVEYHATVLPFIETWFGDPVRHSCSASLRRRVTHANSAAARPARHHTIDPGPVGLRWATARAPLSEAEKAYAEWLFTPEGRRSELDFSRALVIEAQSVREAGEGRFQARRVLLEASTTLRLIVMMFDLVEEDGELAPEERAIRDSALSEHFRASLLAFELERDSDVASAKSLETQAERVAELLLLMDAVGMEEDEQSRTTLLEAEVALDLLRGDLEHATTSAAELLEQVRRLSASVPDSRSTDALRRALVRSAVVAGRSGRIAEAARLAAEVLDLTRERQREAPYDHDLQLDLLEAMDLCERWPAGRFSAEDFRSFVIEHVERARALLKADPSLVDAQLALSRALEVLGDDMTRARELDQALSAYDESLALRKPLQRRGHSGDFGELKELAKKQKIAKAQARGGRFGRLLGQSEEQRARRSVARTIVAAEHDLEKAEEQCEAGHLEEALVRAQAAVDAGEQILNVLSRWPNEIQEWLGTAYRVKGDCEAALGRPADASDSYRLGARHLRNLSESKPDDADALEQHYGAMHRWGESLRREDAKYLGVWEEAAAVARRWVAIEPTRAQATRALGVALNKESERRFMIEPAGDLVPLLSETVDAIDGLLRLDPELESSDAAVRAALRRLAVGADAAGDSELASSAWDRVIDAERANASAAPDRGSELLAEALLRAADLADRRGELARAQGLRDEARSLRNPGD